jgi:ribonuclease I
MDHSNDCTCTPCILARNPDKYAALRDVRDEIERQKNEPAVFVVTLAFSGQLDDSFHRLTRSQLENALHRAFPWATTDGVKVACFEKITVDSDPHMLDVMATLDALAAGDSR